MIEGTTGHKLNSATHVKDLNLRSIQRHEPIICKNTKLDFLAVQSGGSSIQSISKVIYMGFSQVVAFHIR
jgi:hypothetical protein